MISQKRLKDLKEMGVEVTVFTVDECFHVGKVIEYNELDVLLGKENGDREIIANDKITNVAYKR